MLENLHIKNIALIDEAIIDFGSGLNILTGETGAGKSMIIDSVNFVLGERATKDIIRKGADSAQVTALFYVENPNVAAKLSEAGIEIDSDNNILINRIINAAGKSYFKINGSTVTAGMLKQVSEFLLDIHGQHEHQSLLNANKHIELLDIFCGKELSDELEQFSKIFREYRAVFKKLQSIIGDENERTQKIELYEFQLNDIESAKLKPNEEEDLLELRKTLVSSEKLAEYAEETVSLLYDGDTGSLSALDKISRSVILLREICNFDKSMNPSLETLMSIEAELDDVTRDIRKYFENIESDPQALNNVEKRLDLIYSLKRKYGSTIPEILEHCRKVKERLEFIKNSEAERESLILQKSELQKKVQEHCTRITDIRAKNALIIQEQIESVLKDLGMENAIFSILLERKGEVSSKGWDRAEFLISPNKGQEVKPLAKIASGGEMSRVMLAVKTVLADADNIETFIFDEIDTGVSGRTAQKVAEKLAIIANGHQIICITHLPQIASMADYHFLIEKHSNEEKTITNVSRLTDSDTISELARLIGGAEITYSTNAAAKEMKEMAVNIKRKTSN